MKNNIIKDVENELGYVFPLDYCTYYQEQSDLHVKPNLFKVNDNEKVINRLFSMNKDDREYIVKFQSFDSEYKDELVPFAVLEFGDLLCFSREDNSIIYYNHDLDTVTKVADTFNHFKDMLY